MVILCGRDTAATYKLSDISLEYDAKFGQCYAIMTGKLYAATMLILHTKALSIYHQILCKKDTTEGLTLTNFGSFIKRLTVAII